MQQWSLRELGGYEICSVCFWEDDGSDVLDRQSAANRMSLAEAMQNFRALGSVDAKYLPHLRADRMDRFPRT